MSLILDIRNALVAQAQAVDGFGIVHARERYVPDEAKFRQAYLVDDGNGGKQLRGWWLRRVRTTERTVTIRSSMVAHTWQWRGYMAFNDQAESELLFDDLIEAYRDAFRADPTLGGVCEASPEDIGSGEDGVQVIDAGPVTFCGVLCHSAVLQVKTWSYL
jgi:hypothetical protein